MELKRIYKNIKKDDIEYSFHISFALGKAYEDIKNLMVILDLIKSKQLWNDILVFCQLCQDVCVCLSNVVRICSCSFQYINILKLDGVILSGGNNVNPKLYASDDFLNVYTPSSSSTDSFSSLPRFCFKYFAIALCMLKK